MNNPTKNHISSVEELNKITSLLTEIKATPINGHIFVLRYSGDVKEKTVGGIVLPGESVELNGDGLFCRVVIVAFNRDSGFLKDRCHGTIEFEVGDICYAVNNTIVHRECLIGDQSIFCVDPNQLVAKIGKVK